jgi:hypothetical protein
MDEIAVYLVGLFLGFLLGVVVALDGKREARR